MFSPCWNVAGIALIFKQFSRRFTNLSSVLPDAAGNSVFRDVRNLKSAQSTVSRVSDMLNDLKHRYRGQLTTHDSKLLTRIQKPGSEADFIQTFPKFFNTISGRSGCDGMTCAPHELTWASSASKSAPKGVKIRKPDQVIGIRRDPFQKRFPVAYSHISPLLDPFGRRFGIIWPLVAVEYKNSDNGLKKAQKQISDSALIALSGYARSLSNSPLMLNMSKVLLLTLIATPTTAMLRLNMLVDRQLYSEIVAEWNLAQDLRAMKLGLRRLEHLLAQHMWRVFEDLFCALESDIAFRAWDGQDTPRRSLGTVRDVPGAY